MIGVSIVSHGHGKMVLPLIETLLACNEVKQILFTKNVPEIISSPIDPRVFLIENNIVKGFAANHNAAFSHCSQPYFCPINPDITLPANPFPLLLESIVQHKAALAAPLVLSPNGSIEDSVRSFPTMFSLLLKIAGGVKGRIQFNADQPICYPDWVAGMFMLFRSVDFAALGGFDEKFFLYYEDVDICARAWKASMKVVACSAASVIHDARRSSHRNSKYFYWHVASMARYFLKHWGRLPCVPDSCSA